MSVDIQISVVVEENNHLKLFKQIATLQEIFTGEACGKCGSQDIRYFVRKVEDGKKNYEYPELRCQNSKCRAKLKFGLMEGGGMFPVRNKREDGAYLKDANDKLIPLGTNGWIKYNFETKQEE